jgi:hypothetical protein
MFNNLIGKNKELGRFLFCERYTLPPVKNAMYIAEGQELKRGAVVDVNGVLVGTNSLMPYAVLEFDCDTRSGGKEASVFIKGEFNFDKLYFADGLEKSDLDNIVYNGSGLGIVIKPYEYDKGFNPIMAPAGTSEDNPLMTAEDTERMIIAMKPIDANTLRFEFSKMDYDPTVEGVGSNGTWNKLVAKFHNVWDWTRSNNDWSNIFNAAFQDDNNKVDIIAAGDLSTITSMRQFLFNCQSVTSIPNLNTSSVTNYSYAFYKTSLKEIPAIDTSNATDLSNFIREILTIKSIPLFDTGKVTNVQNMCYGNFNVEEGALALYEQMSTQTTPPSTTANCFKDCGKNTETGAAELAQIPASWGGTASG